MTLPLIYIAGPYGSDPVGNTRRAVEAGMALYRAGVAVPLIPHTSLVADLVCPMNVNDWYAYDLHLLERCDAVWRLPGESKGADAEVAWAVGLSLPVFFEREALLAWAKQIETPRSARYAQVDGTTWPTELEGIEWTLRYHHIDPEEALFAASIVAAYGHLTDPGLSQADALVGLKRARLARKAGNA